MEKNNYLSVIFILLVTLISCNSKENKDEINKEKTEKEEQPTSLKYSFISPFDNYFAVNSVQSNTELSLDSIQFSKNFQYAATMNSSPLKINFQKERVGAIVLPETAYDTNIVLDTNYVRNDTLHVIYSINRGKNENTFTTNPVKLFTYNAKFHLVFNGK